MSHYEYKTVPAPRKGEKAKGVKGADGRLAQAMQSLLNTYGAQGWEYQRAETLPVEERSGLGAKSTSFQSVLIFRRELEVADHAAPSFAPAANTPAASTPTPSAPTASTRTVSLAAPAAAHVHQPEPEAHVQYEDDALPEEFYEQETYESAETYHGEDSYEETEAHESVEPTRPIISSHSLRASRN